MSSINLDQSFPDTSIDVSSANRKFQTSHIIKQNESRSGVLNYLRSMTAEQIDEQTSSPSQFPQPQAPKGAY
jgi:hypothetical protein|tara:strand:- start:5798 stop:6013 length:216 start_codon:yes stop_codon:yes gene_type:complete